MRTRSLLLSLLFTAACGGSKASQPAPAAPAPTTTTATTPAACGTPTFSCAASGSFCIEGGSDLKQAMGAQCASGGGTPADAPCAREGMLGGCTATSGLTPNQTWCGTMWMPADHVRINSADDVKAQCAKFGGTFVPTP